MGLETTTYISGLVDTNPTSSDAKSQGDDHIRLLKSTIKATFPNVSGAVTPTHTQLNYVTGVTSAIQTQLDAKGAGTVTSASVVSANGFTGTVATATSTPAITLTTSITGLLKGNGTAISAASAGTDYVAPSGALGTPSSGNLANCTFPTLNQNTTGYASALKSATTTVNVSSATAPSSGQVLTATSDSAATWQTPGAAGSMVLLSTVTASASATADIETTFDSTYDVYVIVASGVKVSDAGTMTLKMKIGGSYVTSGYYGHLFAGASNTSAYAGQTSASTAITLFTTGVSAADTVDFTMHVFHPASTALAKTAHIAGVSVIGTVSYNATGMMVNTGTAALTGIRVINSVGTISGTFRLYGIKNS